MKKIFTLLSFVLLIGSLSAQQESFTKVSDFTGTDINGNEVNLYSLLDDGKVVIVDVFAAWCDPCWSYHEAKILENLYQQYGPAGTDQVVVIGVEAQSTNTNEQLIGISTGTDRATFTLGDWTAGISYPIIDDASIGQILGISYFPTLYTIYPNRMLVETGQLTQAAYEDVIANSGTETVATEDVDARALLYNGEEEGCGTSDGIVRVQNLGLTELTNATITMNDGTSDVISFDWTGSMATYDIMDINIGSFDVNATNDYTVTITPMGTESNTTNNALTATVRKAPASPTQNVEFVIVTDFYPGETAWSIKTNSGTTIASGSFAAGPEAYGGGGADANTEHRIAVEIPADVDCYTVEVTDGYGDGLVAADLSIHPYPGFALFDEYGQALKDFNDADPFFELETDFGFSFEGLSSVATIDFIDEVNMYPNPAFDRLNVEISSSETERVNFIVTDMLGRNILNQTNAIATGANNVVIPTAALASGQYILTMQSEGQLNSYKFNVAK